MAVAADIGGQGVSGIGAPAAQAFGPEGIAGAVVPGNEGFMAAEVGKEEAAEIGVCAVKVASEVDVGGGIERNGVTIIIGAASGLSGPDHIAGGIVLGEEDVIIPAVGERYAGAEGGHRTEKDARDIAVPRAIHGDAIAEIVGRALHLPGPKSSARGIVLSYENVVLAAIGQGDGAEGSLGAKEAARNETVPRTVGGHGEGHIEGGAAGLPRPKDVAGAVILGEKDIVLAAVGESDGAEDGIGTVEEPGYIAVARGIHGDTVAGVVTAAAGRPDPERDSRRVVFGDKNVGTAVIGGQEAAEIDIGAQEEPGDVGVAGRINGERVAEIVACAAGFFCPKAVACEIVFGQENVRTAAVGQYGRAKGGVGAPEVPGNIGVGSGVHGDPVADVVVSARDSLGPSDERGLGLGRWLPSGIEGEEEQS